MLLCRDAVNFANRPRRLRLLIMWECFEQKIIGDTFSYFDTAGEAEKVYQAYVLGLLAVIGDDYIIRSNRESGEGRYDIVLIPYNLADNGIVIEIKKIEGLKVQKEKLEIKLKKVIN